jgi:drug/metabolite transporter (DMT)-like permease
MSDEMNRSSYFNQISGIRRQPAGLAASALASIMWGFGGIFAVLAFAQGFVLTFYRLWIAAFILTAIVYATGRRLTWTNIRASWLGGIFLAGNMAMFFSAVKVTSVANVTVIGAFQPALVLLAARRLFGERTGRWDVLWIILAITGVSIAVLGQGATRPHSLSGDLMAVVALLCWSAYWLVSKHARASHNAMEYTAGVTIMASIVMTPVVLLSGQSLTRVRTGDWIWIILMAIVPGGAHLVMNWAHRYVDASVSSAFACLNPLVAAVAAFLILNQPLGAVQILGLIVAIAAIAVIAARHHEPHEVVAP